jgi:hypothetical protein
MMASSAMMGGVIKHLGFASSYFITGFALMGITVLFYFLIKGFTPD